MFQAKANREKRPGLPVPHPDACGRVRSRDVHGREVGHAEIQVVLVGVRADERRLRDHIDLALPASGAAEEAGGSRFKDQLGRAIMQLRCCLDAYLDLDVEVRIFRRIGRLQGLVPRSVLHQGGRKPADAMGVVYVDGDGRRLPDDRYGFGHIERWLAAAGEDPEDREQQ